MGCRWLRGKGSRAPHCDPSVAPQQSGNRGDQGSGGRIEARDSATPVFRQRCGHQRCPPRWSARTHRVAVANATTSLPSCPAGLGARRRRCRWPSRPRGRGSARASRFDDEYGGESQDHGRQKVRPRVKQISRAISFRVALSKSRIDLSCRVISTTAPRPRRHARPQRASRVNVSS